MGGYTLKHQALSSVEAFSFDTKQWTMMPSMTVSRYGHCAAVHQGQIFVIGGFPSSNGDSIEVYDSETQQWKFHSDLQSARAGSSLVSLK